MAEHRRPEIRFSNAERGTCRWCGEAILYADGAKAGQLDRRRRWHPECVDTYNQTDPREARRRVRKRDRGKCAQCGLDTKVLSRTHRGRSRRRTLKKLGFMPRRSLWELDHIIPLIDGGGHGFENLQTLCVPCHREKTASEARTRAAARGPVENATAAEPALTPPDAQVTPLAASIEPSHTSSDQTATEPSRKTAARRKRRRRGRDGAAPKDFEALLRDADRVNERVAQMLAEIPPTR